jgi:hypothetical protein
VRVLFHFSIFKLLKTPSLSPVCMFLTLPYIFSLILINIQYILLKFTLPLLPIWFSSSFITTRFLLAQKNKSI